MTENQVLNLWEASVLYNSISYYVMSERGMNHLIFATKGGKQIFLKLLDCFWTIKSQDISSYTYFIYFVEYII